MSKLKAKTIQIYLPDGNPSGVKVAQEMESLLVATLIPRARISQLNNQQHTNQYGVYFLFGEENEQKSVYIGQSDNCLRRVKQHNNDNEKEFSHVIILNSKRIDHWNALHANYLEALAIQKIKELQKNKLNRYKLENKKDESTNEEFIDESTHSRLLQNFELIDLLLATFGYSLFTPLRSLSQQESRQDTLSVDIEEKHIFYCSGKEAKALGEYSDEGFIVYQGSTANIDEVPSVNGSFKNMRIRLLSEKILVKDNNENTYVFSRDELFFSPSAAANMVLGRHSNGWIEWKNKNNQTLHDIYRKSGYENDD